MVASSYKNRCLMSYQADNFLVLLRPHYNEAARYCRALCRSKQEAEDLFQDSVVKGLEKLHSLRDQTRFKAWMFTIITRQFYLTQKKQLRTNRLFVELDKTIDAFPPVFLADDLSETETHLHLALKLISDRERTAILLFEIGGLSLVEIQKIQGDFTLSSVKSRLSRTREKLKQLITVIAQANQTKEGGQQNDRKNRLSGF